MRTTLLAALLAFFIQSATAGPGYTLTVTGTDLEGNSSVVESPSLRFFGNDGNVLLPGPGIPFSLDFDFDLGDSSAHVEIRDTSDPTGKPMIFSGFVVFEIGEPATILQSDLGTLSFLLTAPTEEKKADEEPQRDEVGEFSKDDLSKLEVKFHHDRHGIGGIIYNRSSRTMAKLHIRAKASDGSMDRIYTGNTNIKPLSEGHISTIEATLPELPEGEEYSISLERAFE